LTLLRAIELYCRRTNMSESALGRRALHDPRLVSDLRKGRQLRPETLRKLRCFLAQDAA
jgi:hypothetical protein